MKKKILQNLNFKEKVNKPNILAYTGIMFFVEATQNENIEILIYLLQKIVWTFF